MLFAIFCLDKPGVEEKRREVMPAHVAYLATKPVKIVISGPLTSDDGARTVGSLFVVEARDRAAIEAFQQKDPLVEAGIWASVEVRAFTKRVDNRD